MLLKEKPQELSRNKCPLSHMRVQSAREIKGFPKDSPMMQLGHKSRSVFLDSQASDLSSICDTVWTLTLDCLGSNLGFIAGDTAKLFKL